MNQPLKILMVEDSEADHLLVERTLRRDGLQATVHRVDRTEDLDSALAQEGWTLLLSDYSVPGMNFRSTLATVKAARPGLPVILFSGSVGEEEAITLLKMGVWDFVLKDRPGRLVSAIEHAMNEAKVQRVQRQTAEALMASEARFMATFEQAAIGIAQLSLEGHVLRANQRLCDILGYTRDEMLGLTNHNLSHPDFIEPTQARIQDLLEGRASTFTQEKPNRRKDGSTVWISLSLSVVRKADGTPDYLVAVVEDIQRRKVAEEAVQTWLGAFHACTHGIALGEVGTMTFKACNQAFAGLVGRPMDAVVGTPILDILPLPEQDRFEADGLAARTFGRTQFQTAFTRPDGTTVPVEIDLVDLPAADGSPLYRVATVQDLTLRLQAREKELHLERELNHLQRMESVGRLAGGISHDMNNVLGAIMAMADVLEARFGTQGELAHHLKVIHQAAARGRDLVKGLTDFARKEVKDAAPLDLNPLVEREAELMAATTFRRVEVITHLQPSLPQVRGESSALSNALMNLCVNACDAMPEGGTLTLETRLAPDGWVEVCVQDTGEGMPPEVAARAMEPFFTTKPAGKGTGLGLSIVYGTVKAHEGQVSMTSTPGRGTRITLRFPPMANQEPAQPPAPLATPAQRESLDILLVDDDESVRHAAMLLLELLGHRVEACSGGLEALRRLESGLPSDLVLLDLNMPGLSGLETLSRLRMLRPNLPVVASSGHRSRESTEILERFPKVAMLDKPYQLQELETVLRTLCPSPHRT